MKQSQYEAKTFDKISLKFSYLPDFTEHFIEKCLVESASDKDSSSNSKRLQPYCGNIGKRLGSPMKALKNERKVETLVASRFSFKCLIQLKEGKGHLSFSILKPYCSIKKPSQARRFQFHICNFPFMVSKSGLMPVLCSQSKDIFRHGRNTRFSMLQLRGNLLI